MLIAKLMVLASFPSQSSKRVPLRVLMMSVMSKQYAVLWAVGESCILGVNMCVTAMSSSYAIC